MLALLSGQRNARRVIAMNDDLSAARGILLGLAISVPIWVLIWVAVKVF